MRLLDARDARHPPVERLVGDELPVPRRVQRGARPLLHRQPRRVGVARRNFVFGPATLTTGCSPMVLVTTPPQPASNARMMLPSDSVGGADESRKGFSNRRPVNVTPNWLAIVVSLCWNALTIPLVSSAGPRSAKTFVWLPAAQPEASNRSPNASESPRRPHPGRFAHYRSGHADRPDPPGLDRRAHPAHRGGREAGRADPRPAGDLQRPLLLSLAGRPLVRHRRAGAGSDHRADGAVREEVPDGDGRAGLRARAGRRLLQHRRRLRQRRQLPRQVPQEPHPAHLGLLGEVLLQAGQPRLPGVQDPLRDHRRLHLLRPALSPKARACSA